jgi:hypothetical protein
VGFAPAVVSGGTKASGDGAADSSGDAAAAGAGAGAGAATLGLGMPESVTAENCAGASSVAFGGASVARCDTTSVGEYPAAIAAFALKFTRGAR